jgi:hypothetical protein
LRPEPPGPEQAPWSRDGPGRRTTALGCVIVASRMAPMFSTKFAKAKRQIHDDLRSEAVLEKLKHVLKDGDAFLKTKAVQIVGFWPKREEVTVDQELMGWIRELALQTSDAQLQTAAECTLQFVDELDSLEIREQKQLSHSQFVQIEVPMELQTRKHSLTDVP